MTQDKIKELKEGITDITENMNGWKNKYYTEQKAFCEHNDRVKEEQTAKVEKLKGLKIIKDEFCQCGCSKKAHLPHQLDKNGGRCGICFNCDGYTWKEFEFIDMNEIADKIFSQNQVPKKADLQEGK